ncbi:hypothetical protein DFQ28_004089 [Apophysomyces sp. BC1034]|nr:hypothetical protein DFQ30_009360 [Apophysomyces sp. BC1015]KAG0182446.1 hypothetical protein DFQ29_004068 [Apophysomyces sp. BC1021]KAG0193648.1 hypothetical protein DFQ28_004089 [Apophysomyces sp. BC1034]
MMRPYQSISKQIYPARYIMQRYVHGPTEGATTQTKDFGEKEKAAENRWARAHDVEKLKMLQEKQKENEELKRQINELKNK